MKAQKYIAGIFALLLMFGASSSAFAQTTKSASAEYNGNYMGRTVISKYLANFCEIPDDVIVGKIDVLKDCLDKLAGKMRDDNQQNAQDGVKDWRRVLGDTWNMALTQAGTALANKDNYYDDYETLWQSTENTNDLHLDQAAMANATEKQMKPFLTLLSMHSEKIKADVISNLPNVDPKLLYVVPASGRTENVEFTGKYEEIQIVPNALSIYCELNGENFIYEEKKAEVKKCLDTLITKLNSKSAEEKKQASDDYSVILGEQAQYNMLQAVNKSAGNVEYEKVGNAQAKANAQTQTDFETTASHAFSGSLQLMGINDFRMFFASGMKFLALSNLPKVDAAAVIDNMSSDVNTEKKEKEADVKVYTEGVSVTVTPGTSEEVDPNTADPGDMEMGDDNSGGNKPTSAKEPSNDELVEQGAEAEAAKAEAARNSKGGQR